MALYVCLEYLVFGATRDWDGVYVVGVFVIEDKKIFISTNRCNGECASLVTVYAACNGFAYRIDVFCAGGGTSC